MKWFKDRAKEKSTWVGLSILAGLAGFHVEPEQLNTIAGGVVAAIGVIETVSNEKPAA